MEEELLGLIKRISFADFEKSRGKETKEVYSFLSKTPNHRLEIRHEFIIHPEGTPTTILFENRTLLGQKALEIDTENYL